MRRTILLLGFAIGVVAFAVFLNTASVTHSRPALPESLERDHSSLLEEEALPTSLTRESLLVGDGLLIKVVDRSTQAPLAYAEVFVVERSDLGRVTEDGLLEGKMGIELIFLAFADRYQTDSKGTVFIPAPKGNLQFLALTRTHSANLSWKKVQADSLVLELDRVSMVPVKVLDSKGNPAEEVSLGLYFFRDEEFLGMVGQRSNADGMAYLRVPDEIMDDLTGIVAAVTPFLLAADAQKADVDLSAIPHTPILLNLPETGSVEVTVLDESGTPASDRLIGFLDLMWATPDGIAWQSSGSSLPLRFRHGKANLRHVGLGLHLQARAWGQDSGRSGRVEASGPRISEAKTRMTLTVSEWVFEDTFLVGRVLNTEGMVAKSLELEMRIRDRARPHFFSRSEKIRTDVDGRFRYQLQDVDLIGKNLDVSLIMRRTKRKPRRLATAMISQPFSAGDLELGDFVVQELPPIAAGRVVDAEGDPIGQVKVSISHRFHSGARWREQSELNVWTDSDGRFVVGGEFHKGELQLEVRKPEWIEAQRVVSIGEGPVLFELVHGVRVKGRILLDQNLAGKDLFIQAKSPRQDADGGFLVEGDIIRAGDEDYFLENVSPGIMDLEFSTLDGSVFYSWPNIMIDSALVPFVLPDLDLRGRLHSVRISLQDVQGKPVQRGWVRNQNTGRQRIAFGRSIEIYSLDPAPYLVVGAAGKRTLDLGEVLDDQVVTLSDGMEIRLVLDEMPELGPEWRIYSRLRLQGDPSDEEEYLSWITNTGFSREILTSVSSPGTYQMDFYLSHFTPFSSSYTEEALLGNSSSQFEVLDVQEDQVFHFSVSKAAGEQGRTEVLERERLLEDY